MLPVDTDSGYERDGLKRKKLNRAQNAVALRSFLIDILRAANLQSWHMSQLIDNVSPSLNTLPVDDMRC